MIPSRSLNALRAGFVGLSVLLSGAAALAQEAVTIRIVQTNDIDRMGADKNRGGFAKLAAVVKAERAKGNALFIHAGDTISPSLLSGFDKGAHIIDILNHMGVDAMVPGNHEFDLGPDAFRARMAEAKFDIVATNIIDGNGIPANTKSEKIIDVQGIKIGVLRAYDRGHSDCFEPRQHQVPFDDRDRPREGEGAARKRRRSRRRRRPHTARGRHDPRPLCGARHDRRRPRRAPSRLL